MFILRSLTTAIGLLRPTAKEGLYSPASSDFLESLIEGINTLEYYVLLKTTNTINFNQEILSKYFQGKVSEAIVNVN